ncbi:TPA: HlyD family secretion protein [Vibrio parahaemolyticus]
MNGYIFPNKGVIKLYSPDSTYVYSVNVLEGDTVVAGQVIAELRYSNNALIGHDLNGDVANELENQIEIIMRRKINLEALYGKKRKETQTNISSLKNNVIFIEQQIDSALERVNLLNKQLNRYIKMSDSGYLTGEQKESKQSSLLLAKQDVHELRERKAKTLYEINNLQFSFDRLPIELSSEMEKLNLEQSLKQSRLLEIKGQEGVLVRAKTDGMITSLNITLGQEVKPQEYLASILPIESKMEVDLLVPTHAFGFIKAGQPVRIKLGAFPYQKYGTLSGTVTKTTRTIILPTELNLPVRISEPYYRVTVSLDEQYVKANGKMLALKAGMIVKADIITDTRTILEWILDPLVSLVG